MKFKKIISVLIILGVLVSLGACGTGTAPKTSPSPAASAETQTDYRLAAKLSLPDVSSKELAAHLDETAVISFTNTSGDTWQRICLRDYAASNLELENGMGGEYAPGSIKGVKDSSGNELEFTVEEDKSVVYVTLPVPLRPGERMTVTVDYSTEIPCGGERLCWFPDSEGDYGDNGTVCLSQAYPMLAEYTGGKWNDTPYFADGECFFSRCGSFEMTLTVPEGCTVVSTGSETKSSDGTWSLKADRVRDFAVIIGTNFEKLSAKAGDVTVNSYYIAGRDCDKKQGEVSLKAAVDAVTAFESSWGKYPYDTLDVVQAPYNYGGMEYPGMVRIAKGYADDLDSEGDKSLRFDVAHEVAHEWFYAAVGNDQYREAWLDESFAVFGEFVYQLYTGESESDVQERALSLDGTLKQKYIDLGYDKYFSEETGGADYTFAVYKVGPAFLWKLRQTMGKESFECFMHAWYTEHMFKEVTTADFRSAVLKQTSDSSVKTLLDQYLSPT